MKTRPYSPRLSVLVAGCSLPMRAHLRALVNREPGLCLCGEADTGAAALDLFFRFRPDVVLVNACLPDRNGFKVVECIKQALPACQAILLCQAADPCVEDVARMVGADHICPSAGELTPILDLLRALALAKRRREGCPSCGPSSGVATSVSHLMRNDDSPSRLGSLV